MNGTTTLKAFFGFKRHPFPPACAPEPLFCSGGLEAVLLQAHNALQNRLHVLVTAPAGLGKSSFCRLLMAQLNPRDFRTLYLVAQPVGLSDLLRAVAETLGFESSGRKGKTAQLLSEGLERIAATSGTHPVLILDEVQQLPVEGIEFLRLLAESHNRTLLSLVLVATDGFTRLLARPALAPLAGRLAVRVRIPPLDIDQAADFVEHAFTAVGMQNILAPTAIAGLHAACAGSPRAIGAFLATAMQRALEKRSKMLTDEIVQEVLDDTRA
ncbi:MAG: AAA family ATPase [Planctomycetota bacterium]|jgi:general secretion pathway protein A|nr:AAA family ATPase [Planctomycetota bacterium]|tara:strand:+ start:2459 stop:3265 length:807 start_codon:yes stop_codon:yes gene_type:complete